MRLVKENYSTALIDAVWNKATIVMGVNPSIYRKDVNGAWIKRDLYGKTGSEKSCAWEIDHIYPKSKGGSDFIFNLQPLQWYNNRIKDDYYPFYNYPISALSA